jgi:transposase
MRYELTHHEWAAIKPMLPNKPRGVRPRGDGAASARLESNRVENKNRTRYRSGLLALSAGSSERSFGPV